MRNPSQKVTIWEALAPPIYLISIVPAIAAAALSGFKSPYLAPLALATLGVVFLQHGINVLNDVTDWIRRADVEKRASWVRFHNENLQEASVHGWASWFLGGFVGIAALFMSHRLELLLLAAPLTLLGLLYNRRKKPLSYSLLSETITGLCYGPGVFGCYWLVLERSWGWPSTFGSLSFGALAVAVLLSHQPPQVLTDAAAGKRSFAVRFGPEATRRTALVLSGLAFFSFWMAMFFADFSRPMLAIELVISILMMAYLLSRAPQPRLILMASIVVGLTPLAGMIR